MTPIQES